MKTLQWKLVPHYNANKRASQLADENVALTRQCPNHTAVLYTGTNSYRILSTCDASELGTLGFSVVCEFIGGTTVKPSGAG